MHSHFDSNLETKVENEASNVAKSAGLSQFHPEVKKWHAVAFYSKKLSLAECNDNIQDKEPGAIVAAFE